MVPLMVLLMLLAGCWHIYRQGADSLLRLLPVVLLLNVGTIKAFPSCANTIWEYKDVSHIPDEGQGD